MSQSTQTISKEVNRFTKQLLNTQFQSRILLNFKRKETQNLCISLLTGIFDYQSTGIYFYALCLKAIKQMGREKLFHCNTFFVQKKEVVVQCCNLA